MSIPRPARISLAARRSLTMPPRKISHPIHGRNWLCHRSGYGDHRRMGLSSPQPAFQQQSVCHGRTAQGRRVGRPKKYGDHHGTTTSRATAHKEHATETAVNLYGARRTVLFATSIVMRKTLTCPIRVMWVYRPARWVALFTSDLSLSVTQIRMGKPAGTETCSCSDHLHGAGRLDS
jgi:hypothetical protein